MLADGLADRLNARLARGRAVAESRMLSRATIRRKTGRKTPDESTGLDVPEWQTVHTDLPCRLAGTAANSAPYRTLNINSGVQVEVAARVLHVPADTTDLRDGDYAEITAGDTAGSVFQIIEAAFEDQATARRVPVVAVDRPQEWA